MWQKGFFETGEKGEVLSFRPAGFFRALLLLLSGEVEGGVNQRRDGLQKGLFSEFPQFRPFLKIISASFFSSPRP